jgi:hypothetical protein
MPYDSYIDFQAAQWNALADVADAEMNNELVRLTDLATAMAAYEGGFSQSTPIPTITTITGSINVARVAKVNAIKIDGELQLSTVSSVTWYSGAAVPGELYIFCLASIAHRINLVSGSNLKVAGDSLLLENEDSAAVFVVAPSLALVEVGRYPMRSAAQGMPSVFEYVTGTSLRLSGGIVRTAKIGSETRAQGAVVINLGSAFPGKVQVWIDAGFANVYKIGEYTAICGDTDQDIADGLVLSISSGTLWEADAYPDRFCRIVAPIGTGAAANAWTMYTVVTGSITTTVTNIGDHLAGADGAETAATIDTLTEGLEGLTTVFNQMASHTVTLAPGGNIDTDTPLVLNPGQFTQVFKFGSNFYLNKTL